MLSRRVVLGSGFLASNLAVLKAAAAPADVIRIPIRVSSGRLWTSVSLDGRDPVRFMIDTGSGGYLIDDDTAVALGLKSSLPTSIAGVVGSRDARGYWVSQVVVGGALRDTDAYMVATPFEDFIKGALPGWFLGVYKSEIDFTGNEIRLYPSGGPDLTGYERLKLIRHNIDVRPMTPGMQRARDPHLTVLVELDGQKLRLTIDTGAPSMVTLFPSASRYVDLWKTQGARGGKGRGVSGGYDMRMARADTLKIGGSVISRPVISVVDPSRTAYNKVDGLLGLDAIRRFQWVVDAAGGEVAIKPNGAFGLAQRIDRSGLEGQSSGGRIRVTGVLPDSPAQAAGLRPGDVIATKEGSRAFWNALQGAPGEVVEFEVQRDGKAMPVRIVLKDIV